MLEFKFRAKKRHWFGCFYFFSYIYEYILYMDFVFMFCWRIFLWLTAGGSPGIILTASKACYALFSECDPHAPAWSSFTSRSPLPALLSGRNPQLIKTFIFFQFSSRGAAQAHLQLVWLTSRCVCAHVCGHTLLSMNVKEPRAKCAGGHWSTVLCPPLPPSRRYSPSSKGVTHLCQMACGVSLSGSWQTTLWGLRMFLLVQTSVFGCG